MHVFQESLSGSAEHWYNTLDPANIRTWRDMADSFIRHYSHNTYVAPTREDLKKMEKKSVESLRAYALRWRELAAQVQPPLSEKEMANVFINTLNGALLSNLIPHLNSNFTEVVSAGENIEELLKEKKILDPQSILVLVEQLSKKSASKKKEDETNEVCSENRDLGQSSRPTQINHPPPVNTNFITPAPFQAPFRALPPPPIYAPPLPYYPNQYFPSPRPPLHNQYQVPPCQVNYTHPCPNIVPTYTPP